MQLVIDDRVYAAMLHAARSAMPLEACGLCAGSDTRIARFYAMTNADASGEHYRMLPQEQFAAVRDMRERRLDMLAIWHSHPATPARMSDEDLRLAYTPDIVYLILSLAAKDPVLRGFTLEDGRSTAVAVTIDGTDGDEGERP